MKPLSVLFFPVCLLVAQGPSLGPVSVALDSYDGGAVVAEVEGRRVTAAELDRFIGATQQSALSRRQAVDNYAMMLRLEAVALERELEKETPHRQMLAAQRRMLLGPAFLGWRTAQFQVTEAEARSEFNKSGDPRPFDEVRTHMDARVKQKKLQEWLAAARTSLQIVPIDNGFLSGGGEGTDPGATVAQAEGEPVTVVEVQIVLSNSGATAQNRMQALQSYALLMRLARLAEQEKLHEQRTYKEALEMQRRNLLANAALTHQNDSTTVTAEDEKAFYAANAGRYRQVALKVIYVPFLATKSPTAPGVKTRSEDEALALARKIKGRVDAGEDFVKLVKQYSEDGESVKKDGDFATVRPSDRLPDAVRDVVFKLKQGQVSEPLRQANGFYLFRAEQVREQPFSEIREEIFKEIRQSRLNAWMEETRKSLKVVIRNEAYFAPAK